ncbi:MAG TPA: permease, partial [Planctomycetota bacterium]|nr:permease [Planctomycetota bacterium]
LLGLLLLTYLKRGGAGVSEGFVRSGGLLLGTALPMAIGFLLAGFAALLIPQKVVAGWLGEETGLRGILVASLAGTLTPGGPFTHFPLLATLRSHGAGIGPITAYISAWALLGVHRMVIWEGPLLGWRFVLVRGLACLVCPPLTGLFAQVLVRAFSFRSF